MTTDYTQSSVSITPRIVSIFNLQTIMMLDKNTILKYQNRALFSISIMIVFSTMLYSYLQFVYPLRMVKLILGLYIFLDLFFVYTLEMKIHHLFVLCIYLTEFVHTAIPDKNVLLCNVLKMEWSSIFLVLKYWINKKSYLYNINLGVFYIFFFKTRIFDYYMNVIHNDPYLLLTYPSVLSQENTLIVPRSGIFTFTLYCAVICGYYGLYILNIYWFFLMNKMLYNTLFIMKMPEREKNNGIRECNEKTTEEVNNMNTKCK